MAGNRDSDRDSDSDSDSDSDHDSDSDSDTLCKEIPESLVAPQDPDTTDTDTDTRTLPIGLSIFLYQSRHPLCCSSVLTLSNTGPLYLYSSIMYISSYFKQHSVVLSAARSKTH